jgi:hypothetical protein
MKHFRPTQFYHPAPTCERRTLPAGTRVHDLNHGADLTLTEDTPVMVTQTEKGERLLFSDALGIARRCTAPEAAVEVMS